MADPGADQAPSATPPGPPEADLHGRRHLARNILTNWGAQAVTIVSGFLVPRLIDRRLSQEALGVWDLAWSIVVYFNLVQIGVTTSINRFVAFHRAQEDFEGINRVVSSVTMVMRFMGAMALLLSLLFTWAVGPLFHERLGSHVTEARWLVFLLGTSVAVQISATVYGSILTGLHRWDWHNGIHAVTNFVTLVGMVLALLLGYGLVGLAFVNVLAEALGRSGRVLVAYRLCPWLQIKRRHFRWTTAREMLSFGGKSFMTSLSQLLMNSTISLLIAGHLGPAALALYARPMALVRNLAVFVNKYAMVFSPTISSFQGAGRQGEVRDLAIKATRVGVYLSLPMMLYLVVFGDAVLRLWMGARYADRALIAIIVCGLLHQVAYIPLAGALVGLNQHGKLGVANLIGATVALLGAWLALGPFGLGLKAVAMTMAIPMTVVNGVFLPLHASRCTAMPFGRLWLEIWHKPVLVALPFAACLLAARFLFPASPERGALMGAVLGGPWLAYRYWTTLVPERWKHRLLPT